MNDLTAGEILTGRKLTYSPFVPQGPVLKRTFETNWLIISLQNNVYIHP